VPDAAPRLAADTVLAGRYRLVGLIAQGGMAQVWEAHDEILDRPIAVKVLHPHLASDHAFLERFRREAIAAARLAHPDVVAIYDTGVDQDVAFIVMELVRGITLRQLLEQRDLTLGRAVEIAVQVADALDYAHQAGIVHRDVKPGNILICDDGRVKVADFGIAKAVVDRDLTQTGALLGTAKYLSPEQVEGQPQDARSDVYALGVVLYEMVCGRPPFDGETEMAVALQHVQGRPLPPRQVRAGIPRPLEAAILRAMARDPEQRYPTAGDLRTALLSIDLRDDDATAMVERDVTPPEGYASVYARPRRQRWVVPLVVAVALVAVAALVIALVATSSTSGTKRRQGGTAGTAAAGAIAIAGAQAFDPPPGDGHEHDELLDNLHDGNPSTTRSRGRRR